MTFQMKNAVNQPTLSWAQETSISFDNTRVLSALSTGAKPESIIFRTPTPGPEYEIVSRFHAKGIVAKEGACLSIFIEPKVEGAFPDIVAVYWDPETVENWRLERRTLKKSDIRHMHHLHLAGRLSMEDLVTRLGKRKAAELATRLLDAGVADKTHDGLKRRPLKEVFAVRQIIALEAKISDWRKGLDQAVLNSWFSSETYLLLPGLPKGSQVLDEAAKLGVGIVIEGGNLSRPQLKANRERIPRSFASWLFNEWVWQTHSETAC